jgi:hypothetical protein
MYYTSLEIIDAPLNNFVTFVDVLNQLCPRNLKTELIFRVYYLSSA